MKHTTTFFILAGLVLSASSTAHALKIGYVDLDKASRQAPQSLDATKRLESEFSPRKKALEADVKEFSQMEQKLAKDSVTMSREQVMKKQSEIFMRKRRFTRNQTESREDFKLREGEETRKLELVVVQAIEAVAKRDNYDLILTQGVIHASSAVDITTKVVEELTAIKKKQK